VYPFEYGRLELPLRQIMAVALRIRRIAQIDIEHAV